MRIGYTPPPTIEEFILDYRPGELSYSWIVGPFGSGKTTGIFFKLIYMAGLQAPGPDGIRRSRAVVVRNTGNQLNDTTLTSWFYWFKPGQAGTWQATIKNFTLASATSSARCCSDRSTRRRTSPACYRWK
jgi:hypothetical protein